MKTLLTVIFLAAVLELSAAPKLEMPEIIYAAPGVETSLYFARVFKTVAPQNFEYEVTCKAGKQGLTRWYWRPDEKDAGTTQDLTLTVYDDNGQVAQGSSKIVVAKPLKDPARKFTLALFADSLVGCQYPQFLLERMQKIGIKGYTPIGTHIGGGHAPAPGKAAHDGYGGWSWRTFRHHWTYTLDEYNNVQDQAEKEQMKALGINRKPRDTYRLRSPLLKRVGKTTELDMPGYLARVNGGKAPDFILVELGGNDIFSCTDETIEKQVNSTIYPAMKDLLDAFRKAAPDAVIGLVTQPDGGSQDGFGTNYGCYRSARQYKKNIAAYNALIRRVIAERKDANIVELPLWFNLDTENGYIFRDVPAFDGSKGKTRRCTNALHPDLDGGRQMADVIAGWLMNQLNRKGF